MLIDRYIFKIMFRDRKDAGERLARALEDYKNKDPVILAIPRGGVEVGFEVAKYLDAELDILVSRKLPFPTNPEAGFGAVAEDGSFYLNENTSELLSNSEIERIKEEQLIEIARRVSLLRKNRPLIEIENRIVILVDDGLAMGSTMRVSIMYCRNKMIEKIIVAVPVAGQEVVQMIKKIVDEIIVLEIPPYFQAVAQVYHNWHDVTDEEVLNIMDSWKASGHE